MFAQIFYWLLLIGLGFLILKYRKVVYDWTGTWYWAEKYLGRWWTFLALILIALSMIGFGVAAMFGQVNLNNEKPLKPELDISSSR